MIESPKALRQPLTLALIPCALRFFFTGVPQRLSLPRMSGLSDREASLPRAEGWVLSTNASRSGKGSGRTRILALRRVPWATIRGSEAFRVFSLLRVTTL